MSAIGYREEMRLVLKVEDEGGFDGFQVFVDGNAAARPGEVRLREYNIPRFPKRAEVVVRFGGNDGGTTSIHDHSVDPPVKIDEKQGMTHEYVIEPA